ncbi:L-lactate dehydrogenase (cytochrome) [Actinomycetospora succinea]|uniref:L-lactate dehydrogenase (Cytochrome) n=1 Tax=Actinomycetospora succinea TaxID=663603 RepID=A0A4R6VHM7_9PSEU|nr:alpha-hydroxy acid oxidase [Actinomycetospora succinea]TDQ60834.1 L-lactate dehydrogenase (cytochrome) [Actinomycetospora succinea]
MTTPPKPPPGRTARRLPRPSELRPLLRVARPELDGTRRRLARAHTVADLRAIARRRTPRAVFDYTDGAAEAELSLRRARDTFASLEFRPSVLRDVSHIDTSTTLLGGPSAYPFAFAPTGFTRMMHHEGEVAVARVAGRLGVPHTLSTMGTTSPADLAAAAPDTRRWFQLYLWRDRAASEEVVRRAAEAGNEAIMLTVDTPVGGARLRDAYNGLTIPPALTARTLADMARHPHWWLNVLTTDPLEFAALTSWEGTVAELIDTMFDPALNLDDLAWLRSTWNGPLVVKGVQTAEDARRVVDAGADAVIVSNHGGRQLDRAPVPLETLPSVVAEVGGEAEILLDTGIMSGADIVAAVALGASGCLVGRAYLYALMAGGELGVERLATILTAEIRRTMALLGVSSVKDLTPDHVRL